MATSAIHLSDTEQADRSTAVVVAEIGSVRTSVHPRWGRPIVLTTVQVQERIAGRAPDTVEVEQFGLQGGRGAQRLPGDALLVPGDTCILFLKEVDGGWFLTAMGQSRYGLAPSKRGLLLERSLEMQLFVRDARGALVPFRESPRASRSLADFRRELSGTRNGPVP